MAAQGKNGSRFASRHGVNSNFGSSPPFLLLQGSLQIQALAVMKLSMGCNSSSKGGCGGGRGCSGRVSLVNLGEDPGWE
ncbi:hypothetical protein L1049_021864 [Liquidambar formosana]|uniref:Uncharacterized protein n=1 Tax=Liquidambar formosana TaxID=63359 RepID=A0AAP0WNH1_LIQFO